MIDRWLPETDPRPFSGAERVVVVLPQSDDPALNGGVQALTSLLQSEAFELEVELGAPVLFSHDANENELRCLVGPSVANPALRRELAALDIHESPRPFIWIDRARHLVIIDGPDLPGVTDAFQLLRTATRSGNVLTTGNGSLSPSHVIEVLRQEVATTYPAFALRGIDWQAVLDRHAPQITESEGSIRSLQELFAELGDPHTWVRQTTTNARLPYRGWAEDDQITLAHVPSWSFGWRFGARPGDLLLASNVASWRKRTSANPRTLPTMIPHRMLAGTFGRARKMRIRKPDGRELAWVETYQTLPWREPISWRTLDSGTGYLRIRGWLSAERWETLLETALRDLADAPRLLVDLRGNAGGSLIAAQGFRNRFLVGPTHLGEIAFSRGDGTLSSRSPIIGQPSDATRWLKPVRFLVDRQSYSATEDALLGLQGLPHVQLIGEPTGGGSGRPRTIKLSNRISATVSTALTFDRYGRCIEGHGLPVDLALPIEQSLRDPLAVANRYILDLADSGW